MGRSRNDANHDVSLNDLNPKESSWTVHPLHDVSQTDESLTHRPRDASSKGRIVRELLFGDTPVGDEWTLDSEAMQK